MNQIFSLKNESKFDRDPSSNKSLSNTYDKNFINSQFEKSHLDKINDNNESYEKNINKNSKSIKIDQNLNSMKDPRKMNIISRNDIYHNDPKLMNYNSNPNQTKFEKMMNLMGNDGKFSIFK